MTETTEHVRCLDCGAEWTEIYDLEIGSSESSEDDPKPCECESQYEIISADA